MSVTYKERYTKSFLKDINIIKYDKGLIERLYNKIENILKNPMHYPSKRYNLKGKRSAHVGSYVILFEVFKNIIIFYRFKHHDHVYK